jgi:hypothetical protein
MSRNASRHEDLLGGLRVNIACPKYEYDIHYEYHVYDISYNFFLSGCIIVREGYVERQLQTIKQNQEDDYEVPPHLKLA